MTDAQRERFEIAMRKVGYGALKRSEQYGVYEWPPTEHAWQGWQAAEAQQQARIDELLSTLKDLPWRIEDIAGMLQSRGAGEQRIYGCDEWSTPVLNLNTMLDKVNNTILAAAGEVR